MIKDISTYKAIFIDFDDTLCIHSGRARKSEEQYNSGVVSGTYRWQDCSPNIHMKKLVKMADQNDTPLFLISSTCSSVHANAKLEWVKRNYGVTMENYCVGKRKDKLKIMQAYCTAFDIAKDRVLIIDDCWDTLHEAEASGIHSCSPMEVVNYIEELDDNSEE
jgi:hypothetical protein